jgi:hypothetical protein
MLLDHYRTNGLRPLARTTDAVQHLAGFFSRALALEITADRILRYIAYRQEQKAANATINRELAALRRMFILGECSEKVMKRPHITLLQEHNAHKGFLQPDLFRGVVAALPDDLKLWLRPRISQGGSQIRAVDSSVETPSSPRFSSWLLCSEP